jgi:hypothetical protein
MINHIDLSSVLRGAVCELYSNLVTRPTGAAVRSVIEERLAHMQTTTVTVIDFTNVTLLDFSCADEIVAKLVLRYCDDAGPPLQGYFVFRGIGDSHLDAIETVLERHQIAIVAQHDGEPKLVGSVDAQEQRVWDLVCRQGPADATALSAACGEPRDVTEAVLERLRRRRLLMRLGDDYVAVGAAA